MSTLKNPREDPPIPNNVPEVGIPDFLRNLSTSGNPEMRLITIRYPARESTRMEAVYGRVAIVVVVVVNLDALPRPLCKIAR